MPCRCVLLCLSFLACVGHAEGLTPDRLGVLYNINDPSSTLVAHYYATQRAVPEANLFGLNVPE